MGTPQAQKAVMTISDIEKDLGRRVKELVGTTEANVTHSLLEQLLAEIKQTKSITQSTLAKITNKFGEIIDQHKAISERLSVINGSLISECDLDRDLTVVGSLQKTNRLLADILIHGIFKPSADPRTDEPGD